MTKYRVYYYREIAECYNITAKTEKEALKKAERRELEGKPDEENTIDVNIRVEVNK